MSNLWKATTPSPVDISENFTSREFTVVLQHLKPGKILVLTLFARSLLHARDALKSWLGGFIFSCWRRLKISKIWKRALAVAILKLKKPVEDHKSYCPIFLVSATRSSRGLFIPVWNQTSIHSSLGSTLVDTRDQPLTKSFCSRKISRILLRLRKRPVPCLST